MFGSSGGWMRAMGVCREPARVCFGVVPSYLTVALNRLPRRIGVPLLSGSAEYPAVLFFREQVGFGTSRSENPTCSRT